MLRATRVFWECQQSLTRLGDEKSKAMTSVSATSATALQILQRSRTTPAPNELISAAKPAAKAAVAAAAADKSSFVSSGSLSNEGSAAGLLITAYGRFSGFDEAVTFIKDGIMSADEKNRKLLG